jgi:nitroreductase
MLSKPAQTSEALHPLIQNRWSPRAFSSKPVGDIQLRRIFESARWAPSSSNEQPWRFIIGFQGDSTYIRIFSTLVEFNQLWAGTAPVLLLGIAKKTSSKNPERQNKSAVYDLGQALAYLTFQAMAEDLFVHQMGGFDAKKAAELFKLPTDHEVITVSAIGYIGDPEVLTANFKKMELDQRYRQPIEEMVFSDTFGQAAPFLTTAE